MESYSLQNEGVKRSSGLKALLVEIGAIVVLVVIMIFVLSYFKIINLASFFPPQSTQPKKISPTNFVAKLTPQAANAPSYLGLLESTKALHFSVNTTEYEGTIKKINSTGGKIPNSTSSFKTYINLVLGTSQETISTYYSEEDTQKIKVFDKNKKPLLLSDLKIGDKIIVNIVKNNIKADPHPFNEATITRNQ